MLTRRPGVTVLHLDESLAIQSLPFPPEHEVVRLDDIPGTHGMCDPFAARAIEQRLARRAFHGVTLIGSGTYHYVTYFLLRECQEPFSLVLFDHHTDCAEEPPLLSCGNWVRRALFRVPKLRRVVIVGARDAGELRHLGRRHPDVTLIDETEISSLPAPRRLAQRVLDAAGSHPVYVSIDKDVLHPADAATDWDGGTMRLRTLLYALVALRRRRRILGVDLCGEWPVSPVGAVSAQSLRQVRKNEVANRAILLTLRSG
ncbi:arginase family protein [Alicyclobacillus mali]|uniref:Arginase family protein n=1 Tax=Alicyclobacillus mali (ex Roth et al. 2021) TaxID=1123961 RepID=A0ABS0F4R2_9BACL|nr:arginase family protein [Alicyclobacillus mali (ex Roth et al. 2021)]MBF8378272.1 arginase family protein [Alicyclobacillus mali (ex Roth et al. 2021)]MCL6487856.1 arginase family protein [Alicyclobacillus mali (ex Roth et al. 2021)]